MHLREHVYQNIAQAAILPDLPGFLHYVRYLIVMSKNSFHHDSLISLEWKIKLSNFNNGNQ